MDSDCFECSSVLLENSNILFRLENNGHDMGNKKDFEFTVSLPTKEDCKKVRQAFRNKYQVPEGGMFVIIDDPKDFQLVLCVEMHPTAEDITALEEKLLDSASDFGGAQIAWEFKE